MSGPILEVFLRREDARKSRGRGRKNVGSDAAGIRDKRHLQRTTTDLSNRGMLPSKLGPPAHHQETELTTKARPFEIIIPIYDGVDLMDVAAPVEMFSWMAQSWKKRSATVTLVAETVNPLTTRDGLTLTPQRAFAEYGESKQAQLLWVPGGTPQALKLLMKGGAYLDFLKSQSRGADYVTSVRISDHRDRPFRHRDRRIRERDRSFR